MCVSPNKPALQLAGDLTIEMWVNVSLATRQTLISKDYIREFELTLEKQRHAESLPGERNDEQQRAVGEWCHHAAVWQHVVVTRSAATRTVRFYVNGVAKGSATTTRVDPVAGTRAVAIGRSTSGAQYVNGRLDEVALYPAALTAAQVLKHYVMRLADGAGVPVELPLIASDVNGDALTYVATGIAAGPDDQLVDRAHFRHARAGQRRRVSGCGDGVGRAALAQSIVPVVGHATSTDLRIDDA